MAAKDGKHQDISHFSKPYARTTVPAKRPSPSPQPSTRQLKRYSPSPDDDSDCIIVGVAKTPKKNKRKEDLKTPGTTRRFKDVGSVLDKSPIPFKSRTTLPVGSPRPRSDRKQLRTSSKSPHREATPSSSRPVTFDFSSISAVQSSKTSSSQSAPEHSKKVVKDGHVIAIRDSDAGDTDSDTSLEDLDDILDFKKHDTPSSSSSPPDVDPTHEAIRPIRQPRLLDRRPILSATLLNSTNTHTPKHTFTLDNILARHFGDRSTEETVAKTRKNYGEQRPRRSSGSGNDTEKDLLASIACDDDEHTRARGTTRLMDAVERTEAISGERSWSFFKTGVPNLENDTKFDFPVSGLGSDSWEKSVMGEERFRERAFLSGYVAERWASHGIDQPSLSWLLSSIIAEKRIDLRGAYAATLKQIRQKDMGKKLINVDMINELFRKLGARPETLDAKEPTQPIKRPKITSIGRYDLLVQVVECLSAIVDCLSEETIQQFASILVRLMLDQHMMRIFSVSSAVEQALCVVFDVSEVATCNRLNEFLHASITTYLTSQPLQEQLLSHINPASIPLADLRIRLAESFLLSSPPTTTIASPPASPLTLELLNTHLNGPLYTSLLQSNLTQQSKYPFHQLLVQLTFISDLLTPTFDLDLRLNSPADFNAQVDNLNAKLLALFNVISDNGASHLIRTEVKEELEVLMCRLDVEIRIGGRKRKKGLWIDGHLTRNEVEKEKGRGFMMKFLRKQNEKNAEEKSSEEGNE
ncbi:hypothetical protein UCRPC4_g03402 [Phaeomoniella chlamydospora]|uniref:Uncharacterized protein n=1 Tax=Phaeomoniella chlamydospora TaxID=158046 RepID=A0A0G2EIE5_PHACM|nr:hypothetical protein UCRPC4_g03402 [Phaeomoniella chlamydospora]